MTRAEIEKDYNVVNGRITRPGKFEGEMVYVPFFWDIGLDGFANREMFLGDKPVYGFDITAEDRKLFPELKRRRSLHLLERDDGFVCEVTL